MSRAQILKVKLLEFRLDFFFFTFFFFALIQLLFWSNLTLQMHCKTNCEWLIFTIKTILNHNGGEN